VVDAVEALGGARWWRWFQAALLQFLFFFLPCAEAPTSIWNLADAVRKT